MKLYDVRTEYRKEAMGIDQKQPRFSWKIKSDRKNVMQEAYRIRVFCEKEEVWDSGEIQSQQSAGIRYEGKPLMRSSYYTLSLWVRSNYGEVSESSTWFSTGLMDMKYMQADWITRGLEEEQEKAVVFAKTFTTEGEISSARVYMSALGIYEFSLNGKKVSDTLFAPGWTAYKKRIQYQTYDLTKALETVTGERKEHRIEITVGNGWYKGVLGFYGEKNHYGTELAAIAQIELIYEDGRRQMVATDESWESYAGEILENDIYNGEVIDKTRNRETSAPVKILDHRKDILVAQESEPVRITERIQAKRLLRTPNDGMILDFGQNLAGVVEAKLHCERGRRIVLRHGESLDERGNLFTANLRSAKATDTFICSGEEDVFLPTFTYHGFRYVQVEGLEEEPCLQDFTACVIQTDLEQSGSFSCSNELVNRLWKNIDWTMRSNYLDIPTDCPQRDERFGYTGDTQIFVSTAVCQKNILLFMEKWLRDLKAEQGKDGSVPNVVPDILKNASGIAIWHDAACIVPWEIYQAYGDKKILEEQYESMVSSVRYSCAQTSGDHLLHGGQQLGDWIALDVERGILGKYRKERLNLSVQEKAGGTDLYYIANAYYLYSVSIVWQTARILGRTEDEKVYRKLYEKTLQAFRREYITDTGRLISETQTGCALALAFGLVKEHQRERVLDALKENLKIHQNHPVTGFAGTRFLCKVLSENGEHKLAGKVFLQEDCPSWLYSVKLGATTVWELWDGVNEDGSFNKYEMNSLNQYALASIGDWMFRDLCGLRILEAGYRRFEIAPRLIEGITSLNYSMETVYGKISCAISCQNKHYIVHVEIPANTNVVIALPGRREEEVGSGSYEFSYATEDSFDKLRYTEETKLEELINNPAARRFLEEQLPEMVEDPMTLRFAGKMTVGNLCEKMPKARQEIFVQALQAANDD